MAEAGKAVRAVRGMNDILPEQTGAWQHLEDVVRELLRSYGYQEIRMPIVEKTELFRRSIGEVTDIVEKEMYTFEDRNGDSLSLRPEGTASCVRACIEHGLLHNQVQRLWYGGPMFRHERPQKGRFRQFHQVGVEAFGLAGPDIDAELILITARLWRRLGVRDVRLELNSLGTSEARSAYRERLVDYLSEHQELLDDDSRRRLHTNPLRILDSKNPHMQELIDTAPRLADHLDPSSRQHFAELCARLDDAGIAYSVNPRLVRGLDYYSHTVFEWVTERLGAQGTVCAGGRFDGLVAYLGGQATPAVGFALGLERVLSLLEDLGLEAPAQRPHVYLVLAGTAAHRRGLALAEDLRDGLPSLRLQVNCGGGSFKSQFKRADRSGASLALILGDDEVANASVAIKPLRGGGSQEICAQSAVAERLAQLLDFREPPPQSRN